MTITCEIQSNKEILNAVKGHSRKEENKCNDEEDIKEESGASYSARGIEVCQVGAKIFSARIIQNQV